MGYYSIVVWAPSKAPEVYEIKFEFRSVGLCGGFLFISLFVPFFTSLPAYFFIYLFLPFFIFYFFLSLFFTSSLFLCAILFTFFYIFRA